MRPIRPVQANPLRESLPKPIKTVIDTLLPEDDPFGGLGVGVIEGPSSGLLKALSPLTGSLGVGKDLANELAHRMPQAATEAPPSTLARKFMEMLGLGPEPVNANTVALAERSTGSRPPIRNTINAPSDLVFQNRLNGTNATKMLPARDPNISAVDKIWSKFEEPRGAFSKLNKPPLSSYSQDRPKLSGAWNNKGRLGPKR